MEITGMTIEQSVNTTPNVTIDAITSNGDNITYTTNTNTIKMNDYLNTNTITTTTGTDYWNQGGIITVDNYSNICWGGWNSNLEDTINDIIKRNKEKENEKMTNEFDFGPYNGSDIRLSTYGIALKNKVGKFVSYDRATKRLMDVDVLNVPVETKKIFYKIPKALEDVREGDVIIHNGILVFVENKLENERFLVVDPVAGTEYVALPLVSPFGYNFLIALESIVKYLPEASASNPFGAFLPLILGSKDTDIFTLMLMHNKNFEDIDPMILMAMSGNNSNLALLMMLKNNKKINFNEIIGKEDINE